MDGNLILDVHYFAAVSAAAALSSAFSAVLRAAKRLHGVCIVNFPVNHSMQLAMLLQRSCWKMEGLYLQPFGFKFLTIFSHLGIPRQQYVSAIHSGLVVALAFLILAKETIYFFSFCFMSPSADRIKPLIIFLSASKLNMVREKYTSPRFNTKPNQHICEYIASLFSRNG